MNCNRLSQPLIDCWTSTDRHVSVDWTSETIASKNASPCATSPVQSVGEVRGYRVLGLGRSVARLPAWRPGFCVVKCAVLEATTR
jgi:hypothetical protein